ncbi:hypothetical protein E3N88_07834 [Mikania micrantha]|uniref:TAFII28-like protein domain-containing protein n=1 Tax=Mikania micrantha TaxID=192012 RepID=A0A5N6PEJ0_9ASTR|nr:hypothetical protein E3N88_07834 [Mikania micrantha]
MKQSKDPFEVAAEESPPESPVGHADTKTQDLAVQPPVSSHRADAENNIHPLNQQKATMKPAAKAVKNKEDDDEEEEENMDVELGKFPSSSDPAKLAKMHITGSNKISMPMTIVVSGIAKIFVGELVETAKVVMRERKESGPIRPCHVREAYRRLKLEGKIPKRSVQRLFR